ncbi:hypothetical protein [Roseomonas sp. USHLN139]|uniref:hypothetical protein n=1 Tax=Roseomonas sp. USHLN139 TaxID=3081298 RepID=UPI003B026E53
MDTAIVLGIACLLFLAVRLARQRRLALVGLVVLGILALAALLPQQHGTGDTRAEKMQACRVLGGTLEQCRAAVSP